MRARTALLALSILPLSSCSYFWFFGYPKEAQRVTRGEYAVVAYVSPTSPLLPELIFGSVHNNTTVDIALIRNGVKIAEAELVSGEDLPVDHLPVAVSWAPQAVTVTEPKYGRSVTLAVPGGGT